jgi:phosphatidylglycerophosphate synthase
LANAPNREAAVLTIPNALSLFRLLLGLAFPWLPTAWRVPAVIVAAVSDGLDGAVGRATGTAGPMGRLLDPLADKVFVLAVLVTLVVEGTLALWQVGLLLSRDVAVGVRAGWDLARRGWSAAETARPSLLGKAATALQFLTLLVTLWRPDVMMYAFVPTAVVSVVAGLDYLRPAPAADKHTHQPPAR